MAIYLMILLFILISGLFIFMNNNGVKQQKVFLWINGVVLVLISTFRSYSVGTDTISYIEIFGFSNNLTFNRILTGTFGIENGYLLYNKILHFFSAPPQIMLMINSVIITFGVFYFIYKNSSNIMLSVYLYITMYYFAVSLNIMRQFLVLSLFLLASEKLKENKWLLYIFIILFASMLHNSSLILLTVLFIKPLNPTVKNMSWIFIVLTTVTTMLYSNPSIIISFSGSYSKYIGTSFFQGNQIGGTVIIWLVQIIIYFISMNILNHSKHLLSESEKNILFFSSIMVLISVCIGVLGTRIFILSRMIYFFDIFMIVLIPLIIKYRMKEKGFVLIIVYLLLLIYFVYNLSTGGSGVTPYEFIWQM